MSGLFCLVEAITAADTILRDELFRLFLSSPAVRFGPALPPRLAHRKDERRLEAGNKKEFVGATRPTLAELKSNSLSP